MMPIVWRRRGVIVAEALVLNKYWQAIHVTSMRRALCLVYRNAAKVISPDTNETYDFQSWADLGSGDDDESIRAVSFRIRVPEVIVLHSCEAQPRRSVVFSRKNLFRRDQNTCQYCGLRFPREELTIDHVVPVSKRGKTNWENCVVACRECNTRKDSRNPTEAGMKLIRPPMRPKAAFYLSLPMGKRRRSWDKFISDAYWNVELESD